MGRVFNSRFGHVSTQFNTSIILKQPNLQLKTRPEQLLGSLPLAFALPTLSDRPTQVVIESVDATMETTTSKVNQNEQKYTKGPLHSWSARKITEDIYLNFDKESLLLQGFLWLQLVYGEVCWQKNGSFAPKKSTLHALANITAICLE